MHSIAFCFLAYCWQLRIVAQDWQGFDLAEYEMISG